MNVVIVGNFWFPHGTASAARIRNIALGLRECGARVHVMTLVPQPRSPLDAAEPTEHEGVSYECAAPFRASVDGWRDADHSIPRLRKGLASKIRWFAGLYGAIPVALRRLARRIDEGGCDVLLAYDRSALRMGPLARLCRARGVVSLLDITEISEHLTGSRWSAVYWDSRFGTRTTPRLYDGVTVITSGLEKLFRAQGCERTLVLPAMEAWPPDTLPGPTGNDAFRLAYVGALQDRDAPELLLEAVWRLAQGGLPVTLDVIGHFGGTERGERLRAQCARDATLGRVVRFVGSVSDREMRARLAGADALVLPRRDSRPERLSFPTRLVEYLRYGRPVLVSDVGDVSLYLEDGIDAVLLPPADPKGAAGAMERLARLPDRGAAIGRRGRETGARSFDRKTHASRLLEFASGLGARACA
jgi:glycosyltransferase involved in cell wall biosynthesis